MNLKCWNCGKDHKIKYRYKIGEPVYCECGGTVISNSGKVMGYAKKIFDEKDIEESEKMEKGKINE